MAFLRFVITLLTCLLLTACLHLSNRDTSSPVLLTETFSISGTSPAQSKWWLDLKDEPLSELIHDALESNLELKNVWQRIQQARALVTQANADLYPDVNGEASISNTEASNNILESRNLSLGLAASYELDLWGRIQATADAQNLEALASEAAFKAASISLSAEVASTWYRYVEQKAQIDLLTEQLANNQQTLDFIEFRFKQGKVKATDVLQQRQLVENRRGEIISAKSSAAVLAHSLAVLRGDSPGNIDLPDVHKFQTLPPLPATGVPSELVQNRPDIQQSLLRVKAADQRVAAALADQYPRLTLSANIRTSSETLGGIFEQWLGSIAANLIAPLFDAGSREAAVKQQQALLQERINDYGQSILNAMQEVENALQQESHQRRLIANLDERLTLSTQIIQRIKDNYNNGVEDYLSVLSAELTDQELQRSRLTAQRQILEFRIALYRALARGWQG
ncbi:MAG: membrane protein [marine bacterium B5-7]|nr:MAG: membrane protein [marine bacterium B5-7]